jgi:hypothetical protein
MPALDDSQPGEPGPADRAHAISDGETPCAAQRPANHKTVRFVVLVRRQDDGEVPGVGEAAAVDSRGVGPRG